MYSFRFILICQMLLSYCRFITATGTKKKKEKRDARLSGGATRRDATRRCAARRVCSRFYSLVNRPALMSSWIERRRQLCHSGNAGMPAVAPGPYIGTRRTANQFARPHRPHHASSRRRFLARLKSTTTRRNCVGNCCHRDRALAIRSSNRLSGGTYVGRPRSVANTQF